MKNKFLFFMLCMLFGVMAYGQNSMDQSQKVDSGKKEKTLEERMEGTYMVINKDPKFTQVLTTDVLLEIDKRRADAVEIYYEYSKYITIKILPKSVINAPDFDPKKFY